MTARRREMGPSARFDVSDNGIGIAPEDLPHIWDRLLPRRPESGGARAGARIEPARAIVAAHGAEPSPSSLLAGRRIDLYGSTARELLYASIHMM